MRRNAIGWALAVALACLTGAACAHPSREEPSRPYVNVAFERRVEEFRAFAASFPACDKRWAADALTAFAGSGDLRVSIIGRLLLHDGGPSWFLEPANAASAPVRLFSFEQTGIAPVPGRTDFDTQASTAAMSGVTVVVTGRPAPSRQTSGAEDLLIGVKPGPSMNVDGICRVAA